MSEPQLCPQCGSEIPAGAPAGLCPKCLVLAGLESQPAADPQTAATQPPPSSGPTGFVPPRLEDIAARFPQLEILELLGRGGMGAVYKARQRELDRLVAVKVLPPEVGRDAAFAERFTREARAMARLSHPNIVGVYDFGRTSVPSPSGRRAGGEGNDLPSPSGRGAGGEGGGSDIYYFIMEFVDAVNLRQAIQAAHMDPKQALAIVPQICDALQFAHDEGVVHRDIKPENILIDKRGRVKIADFGLAKLLGQETADHALTMTQQVLGTLRYMAPEQMEGSKTVDHRADIYSLGVVFYELLTGDLPIGRFAPPSKKVEIDVRLDEVVLRALEKEPEKRYQHASEVKTEVEQIRGGPAAAAPKGGVAAGARLAPLAVAGLVVGIAGPICGLLLGALVHAIADPYGNALDACVSSAWLISWVATPVMGAIGLAQIRRSGGKLYGLRMALFEVIVLPAILLYCVTVAGIVPIIWAWYFYPGDPWVNSLPMIIIDALFLLVVEVLICRWLWKKLLGPPTTRDQARTFGRRLIVAAALLILLNSGAAAWYAWNPPCTVPLRVRLLGAWEGTGDASGPWITDVQPGRQRTDLVPTYVIAKEGKRSDHEKAGSEDANSAGTKSETPMRTKAIVRARFSSRYLGLFVGWGPSRQAYGSYSWRQEYLEDSGRGAVYWFPRDAAAAVEWSVLEEQGDELRIQMHLGEATIEFHGENDFTMTLPESANGTDEYTFHRADKGSGARPNPLAGSILLGIAAISLAVGLVLAIGEPRRRNALSGARSNATAHVATPRVVSYQVRAIGKTSLWTAIIGMIVPILLALIAALLENVLHPPEGYFIVCGALLVLLELAALVCGIVGWRAASGKAGIAIAVVSLALVVSVTTILRLAKEREDEKNQMTSTTNAAQKSAAAKPLPSGARTSGQPVPKPPTVNTGDYVVPSRGGKLVSVTDDELAHVLTELPREYTKDWPGDNKGLNDLHPIIRRQLCKQRVKELDTAIWAIDFEDGPAEFWLKTRETGPETFPARLPKSAKDTWRIPKAKAHILMWIQPHGSPAMQGHFELRVQKGAATTVTTGFKEKQGCVLGIDVDGKPVVRADYDTERDPLNYRMTNGYPLWFNITGQDAAMLRPDAKFAADMGSQAIYLRGREEFVWYGESIRVSCQMALMYRHVP